MASISNLSFALGQIERIQDQQKMLSDLTYQLTTGRKTDSFSELGTNALVSKRTRASLASLKMFDRNITTADNRIETTVLSINAFRAQAATMSSTMVNFPKSSAQQKGDIVYYDDPLTLADDRIAVGRSSGDMEIEFQNMRDMAETMYDFMVDLLNSRDGSGRYLLGGAETLTKPIDDNGILNSAINQLISDWKDGTITTDELIADLGDRTTDDGNTNALTDTIIGYNSVLSAGNVGDVSVRVSESTEFEYTALANEQGFRDIMVGLAFLRNENLPPMVDVYEEGDTPYPAPPSQSGAPGDTVEEMKNNFYQVFDKVSQMINQALDRVDQTVVRLENVRARMEQVRQDHVVQRSLFQDIVSGVEDADLDEAAVKINTLTIQLDASYRVTASIQGLSLVNFL